MAENCTLFGGLSPSSVSQCVTVARVKRVTASVSLIGCFCMLLVIWLFRKYNSLAQKMILSLAVAAFFDSIAYIMSEVLPDGVLCNFQAWWLTYFDWCALAWVCCITLNLYLNVVKEMRTDRFQLWITEEHVAWRFVIWYIPLFSLIFLMMLCYLRIIYVAKQRVITWSGTYDPGRERSKIIMAEEIKPLKWYPCVYLAVSLFPLLNRLHNAFYPSQPVFILTLLHVMSAPLHGLANAFVFVLDKETWSQLTLTSLRVAFQSRLCDSTKIKEYHPANVRYMSHIDEEDSDSDDDTTVLFSMPSMTLRDKGP
ncbi:cyclic AMP receptor-like protein A isoform X2 [Pseudophryne corroboree]|uniref:cyclic AMP receptor-like protein A isoform X2 n=1 Tax=Pseudophryne corroboree TaxID=495146 RepID=UPI0030812919